MKRNIFKKTLATVLALVMVLGTLATLPMTAFAATGLSDSAAWDGSTKTQPTGAGTEADPYVIASAANLAWLSDQSATLAAQSGKLYLKLTANIDLAGKPFTPINLKTVTGGDAANGFTYAYRGVVIAGQGAIIKGLIISGVEEAALFTALGNGSSVDDLHFVGVNLTSTVTGLAATLAATVEGTVSITKVTTDTTSKVTGRYAGGIVGATIKDADGGSQLTLTKCLNRASVTGNTNWEADKDTSSYVGGMIGYNRYGNSVTFSYCVNEGTLTANTFTKAQGAKLGGIIGFSLYESNADTIIFENCYNAGKLVATNTSGGSAFVAGMGAHVQTSIIKLTNCYDYSIRDLGSAIFSNHAIIGDGPGAESVKHFTDLYASNNIDSLSAYSAMFRPAFLEKNVETAVNFNNDTNVKISITSEIATTGGASTMLAEMTKIANVVGTTPPVPTALATDTLPRDYSWYTAEGGTEAAPYEIGTAAQWAAFSALTNGTQKAEETAITGVVKAFDGKYIKLTANIDLTGYACAPVNMDKNAMTIHLDGAGHSISGLVQGKQALGGLFGFVSGASSFKNLTLKNSTISATSVAGGFVAETDGGISFLNCKTEDMTVSSTNNAGGFVGQSTYTAPVENRKSSYDACINGADVSVVSGSFAAGFFGWGAGKAAGVEFVFRYCVNKGEISLDTAGNHTALGGFIGKLTYGGTDNHDTMIEAYNCYNIGALNAKGGSNKIYMAGFLGWGNIGGEIYLDSVHDYSARVWSDSGLNGGIIGDCARDECIKVLNECFAVNNESSQSVYSMVYAATRSASTLADATSAVVLSLTDEIAYDGEATTLEAELARIDAVLASVDAATGAYEDPYANKGENSGGTIIDPDADKPGDTTKPGDDEPEDEATDGGDETTEAADGGDETTAAPAEEGCGSFATATFAVLALSAVCGMGLVGKKKED